MYSDVICVILRAKNSSLILKTLRLWRIDGEVFGEEMARRGFLIRLDLTATLQTLSMQQLAPRWLCSFTAQDAVLRRRWTIVFSLRRVTAAWCPVTWRHVAASSWFSCVLKQHLSPQPAVPVRVISGPLRQYRLYKCITACVDAYSFTPENTPSTPVVKFKDFSSKVRVLQSLRMFITVVSCFDFVHET